MNEPTEPRPARRRGRWIGASLAALLALGAGIYFGGPVLLRRHVFSQLQPGALPHAEPPEGLPSVSAESCGSCHVEVYREWQGSGMARAYTGAAFQADWEENDRFFFCLNCHTPLENQQPRLVTGLASLDPMITASEENPRFDATLRDEGVTCVVCHLQDGKIAGPHECETTAHEVAPRGRLGHPDQCGTCHQFEAPFTEDVSRPLSDTVDEWRRWQATTGRTETCVDCHMPVVQRPAVPDGAVRQGRRHTFPGSRDVAFLRSGLTLDDVEHVKDGVFVTITNLAGHHYPSGEPARALEIRITGTDTWSTWLSRRVHFPERREEWDTTLRPGETRRIRVQLGPGVAPGASLLVEVRYHRLHHLPHALAVEGGEDGVVVAERRIGG